MKKTVALFALAALLFVVACFVGVQHYIEAPPIEPTPTVVTKVVPVQPVATSNDRFAIGEAVRLNATLGNPYVATNTPSHAQILFDLAAVGRKKVRSDVSVVLVIDRSGSMVKDDKFNQAKSAARSLIERLHDNDQVALVSYSTDVSLDVPLTQLRGQRGRLARSIDNLLDGGATNLGGGLQKALSHLRSEGNSSTVRRILVLSDGEPNQGMTEPDDLAGMAEVARREGITISTLGVGLDFGEDLMTLIAQSGGGGYYYARNGAAVNQAFDSELASLEGMAARNVEVSMELAPGVSVSEVYGYRTEQRNGRIVIPIGDMADSENRRIMLQVFLPPQSNGQVAIADVKLSYNRPSNNVARTFSASLSAATTSDAATLASGGRSMVETAFAAAAAAKVRQDAADSYARGDSQQALEALQRQLQTLRQQNKRLKSKSLNRQQARIRKALDRVNNADVSSDVGRDYVKSEKLEARKVFAY